MARQGMKIYLELDIKPFGKRKSYKPYRGLYTPKGRRNQRARIEIDSNQSYIEQISSFIHEIGHFICDVWGGFVLAKNRQAEKKEHLFCEPFEKSGTRIWEKFLGTK